MGYEPLVYVKLSPAQARAVHEALSKLELEAQLDGTTDAALPVIARANEKTRDAIRAAGLDL